MKYQSSAELPGLRRKGPGQQQRPQSFWKTINSRLGSAVLAVKRWVDVIRSFILLSVSKDQQRTYHSMRFLFATEGRTFERSLSAFRATSAGRDLLQRRPNTRTIFSNRSILQAYPPDSLGYWYAEFMTVHGLDEEHYLSKAVEIGAAFGDDHGRAWFHTRVDASHDIRHVLAGYGPDVLGEICLLSFRFGQIRHAGILALALLGLLKLVLTQRGPVVGPMLEAYQRGRRARLLDLVPWEDGFDKPLGAHRAALGLTPSKRYPTPFAPEAY
jgi:ubiquinone biosynthesis protein COQ4